MTFISLVVAMDQVMLLFLNSKQFHLITRLVFVLFTLRILGLKSSYRVTLWALALGALVTYWCVVRAGSLSI